MAMKQSQVKTRIIQDDNVNYARQRLQYLVKVLIKRGDIDERDALDTIRSALTFYYADDK